MNTAIDNTPTPRFTQPDPDPINTNGRGWKTWHGYLNESEQLAHCLYRNRTYIHEVAFSFDADLTEGDHRTIWAHVVRRLKASNLSGIWIRELTKADRIRYHLLFTTDGNAKETLETAVPKAMTSVSRIHLDRVHNQFQRCFYFTNAKIAGSDPKTGKWTNDRWRDKRRFFHKEVKLDEAGSFGKLWTKKKEAIWQQVIEQEKAIVECKAPDHYILAQHLVQLVDRAVPRRTIERNLAIHTMKEKAKIVGEITSPTDTYLHEHASSTIETMGEMHDESTRDIPAVAIDGSR